MPRRNTIYQHVTLKVMAMVMAMAMMMMMMMNET